MPIDYSKWKDIEVSDDEDDTHPNIDTPSLFRWRHQARLERMAERKQKKDEIFQSKQVAHRKIADLKAKVEQLMLTDAEEAEKCKAELSELERQEDEFRRKEEELAKQEEIDPWNVDTISQEGFSKSRINKVEKPKPAPVSEEQREQQAVDFWQKNKDKIKKFSMFKRYDDSKQFLLDNPDICCEETANYMVIECLNNEMLEKHDLMAHVAHQTIIMQFLLELAKQLEMPPSAAQLISSFFAKMKLANEQYMDGFNDELNAFKQRIRARAKEKIAEAQAEAEEEERQARLGPGGLDPVDVFESLPTALKECFESRDLPSLQKAIAEMDPQEAKYHIDRCTKSGLWVPERGDKDSSETAAENGKGANASAMEQDPTTSQVLEGQELRHRRPPQP